MESVEEKPAPAPAPAFCERKTAEEAEYESKMLTQKSLFELGQATAKEAMKEENQEAVEALFEEGVADYTLDDGMLEMIYATPTYLMDMALEKQCDEVECLKGIKSKVVKKDVLKLVVMMEILKRRLKKEEEENDVEMEEREDYETQLEEYIHEVEGLEKTVESMQKLLYTKEKEMFVRQAKMRVLYENEAHKSWGYFVATSYYFAFIALLLKFYVF